MFYGDGRLPDDKSTAAMALDEAMCVSNSSFPKTEPEPGHGAPETEPEVKTNNFRWNKSPTLGL